jgi:tetraprenyl-beta-curcumene synthase
VRVQISLRSAGLALVVANARYWLTVAPYVMRELRRWEACAHAIDDPVLRAHALAKLREERFNAEVATTLSTLAPRRHRRAVIVAIVAFQVLYDYLDGVGEQPAADPLADGFQLYRAFAAALTPEPTAVDYYRHHPRCDGSGYLDALAGACREAFRTLPASEAVAPIARRVAQRCGEAQTRTHAIGREGTGQLVAWAAREADTTGLMWWEVAAGAAASVLAVHALIGAAADASTTREEAARIDAAYLPISAITTLLDSVIDRDRDVSVGSHGFVAYYPSGTVAAERIGAVARRGAAAAWTLRHGPHHAVTVAGAAAYYLSAPGARTPFARPVRRSVVNELKPLILPILGIFHVWREAKRLRATGRPRPVDTARR